VGKSTSREIVRVLKACVSDCSWRTSRLGLLSVKLRASGAVKMVFSVFASTEATSKADWANRELSVWDGFIVVAIERVVESGFAAR
jgi:hypothetical protein